SKSPAYRFPSGLPEFLSSIYALIDKGLARHSCKDSRGCSLPDNTGLIRDFGHAHVTPVLMICP
ncbi:hypothetical protein K4H00_22580, partial [Mycobacterium tuberculosis]|nr:hypothetical protein [Mycobacterium tuberculosis]